MCQSKKVSEDPRTQESPKNQQVFPEKQAVPAPIPKKGNAKECSHYRTTVLISHASKEMFKIFQVRLQQYVNPELPDEQAGFRKAEETEIKLPTFVGSQREQGISRKTSASASLTMLKPLTVCITTNCGKFLETGIPDQLTCLLRNLYATQKATDMEQQIGSKQPKEFVEVVYCDLLI